MAKEASCDLLHGIPISKHHHNMFQSDSAYAEELQFQEALQISLMFSSQTKKDDPSSSSSSPPQAKSPFLAVNEGLIFEKSCEPDAWEEAISKVIQKSECPICHELFCNKCFVSPAPSPSNEMNKNQVMDEGEKIEEFTENNGKKPALCFHDDDDDDNTDNSDEHDSGSSPKRKKTASSNPVVPAKVVPKWKGLKEKKEDHEIVWPPMVVIRNTSIRIENKWIGMGNQELLERFRTYTAIKVHHFYGPQGHRGWSLLIFDDSVHGYLEAERLHKSFYNQGLGRSYTRNARPAHGGEEHQLYGYLAGKGDMEFIINKICNGNLRLKYEVKSYKEMVVNQVKRLYEENKQVMKVKQMFVEEKMRADDLDESIRVLRDKLEQKMEEVLKLRQKIQQQHDEHEEEVEFQEKFFKDQIRDLEKKVGKEATEMDQEEEDGDFIKIKREMLKRSERVEWGAEEE